MDQTGRRLSKNGRPATARSSFFLLWHEVAVVLLLRSTTSTRVRILVSCDYDVVIATMS